VKYLRLVPWLGKFTIRILGIRVNGDSAKSRGRLRLRPLYEAFGLLTVLLGGRTLAFTSKLRNMRFERTQLTRRRFLQIASGFGVSVGMPSAAELGYATRIEPLRVVTQECQIRIPRLPTSFEGFKIALFSDIHLYPFTPLKVVQDAVRLANAFRPDLVVLAGDFVWRSLDAAFDLVPVLCQLNPANGSFAVLGNHDHRKGPEIIAHALAQAGVRLLCNEGITIQRGRDAIYLAGIDSAWGGNPLPTAAFEKRRGELTSIVAVHEPDYIRDLVPRFPVDLQLSGHSHGGQVRLPVLGPLILPPMGEIYNMGLYRVGNAQVYTTRGIGTIHVNARLNCPPEVTAITLHA
jgi:predicted MPP superfamily phosphohydrolase